MYIKYINIENKITVETDLIFYLLIASTMSLRQSLHICKFMIETLISALPRGIPTLEVHNPL